MTAKNVSGPSIPDDVYLTPSWAVDQCILEVLPILPIYLWQMAPGWRVLEPGAGHGAVVDAMRRHFQYNYPHIHAVEINPHFKKYLGNADKISIMDFLEFNKTGYTLAIGNPPYTYAREFIEKCWEVANWTVFLLRQGFMSSIERALWFRKHPPYSIHRLVHRPKFVPGVNKTDSSDYAWMVWGKGGSPEVTKLYFLDEVSEEKRGVRKRKKK